jgi:hypothetical protein
VIGIADGVYYKSNSVAVLLEYFVVLVDELAVLDAVFWQHGLGDIGVVVVEGGGVDPLQPVVEVFLEDVCPGDRSQHDRPVGDGVFPGEVDLLAVPLVAMLAVLKVSIQQLILLTDICAVLLHRTCKLLSAGAAHGLQMPHLRLAA